MENDDLKLTWRKIDDNISPNSKEELNRMLLSKTKKVISKYLYFIGISGLISIGVIIFLAITMMNRWNDLFYRSINILLIVYTIYSFYNSIVAFNSLRNNKANLPLKDWLKQRISMLSMGLSNKIVFYILPVICMLLILSIHVYFEGKPFVDVVKTEESIVGLVIGFVIGLTVAYLSLKQIRNQQRNNLDLLKEIHYNLNE